eukprot:TRINITY_DN2633_c0_g1_i1.p1 TRINITY_DN2633_c0_g1~~TRINITY_DN2633_c0_g1_i1.p1  ORF type:complete len:656 (+),score=133.42 TRINITY_DN2633_c0_g1_i1:289-2256(+)
MTDLTEILNRNTIEELIKPLLYEGERDQYTPSGKSQQEEVGVVGGLIVFPDQTIYHAGLELALQKNPEVPLWDWQVSQDTKEVPAITHTLQGYTFKHKKANTKRDVLAVSKDLMAIPRNLFFSSGAFNETFNNSYFDVDLCLRLQQNFGKTILYNPSAVALYNDKQAAESEYDIENTKSDITVFNTIWGDKVRDAIEARYEISNFTLVWNMECGSGQVLGFTMEAINFVLALNDKIKVKIDVNRQDDCVHEIKKVGLPLVVRSTVARLMFRQTPRFEDIVTIIHRDPGRYSYFTGLGNVVDIMIGRSMYETDKIPQEWPASCNSWKIDKIWVPTAFNKDTFTAEGVNASKIDIVPELIDVDHFDPSIHDPIDQIIPQNDGIFKFLTVLKWEPRKAWDVLLRAYFDEFKRSEPVRLYIISRLDQDSQLKLSKFLEEYQQSSGVNDTSNLPTIEVINTMIPYTKLPSLYKSVDCMVLPSHGEGWGLPLTEAMCMGLPTIGTEWSGTTAFMTNENSFLVDVAGMEPAMMDGHHWATPNTTTLRKHMRTIFEKDPSIEQKQRRARSDIVEKFSLEAVGNLVLGKLKDIQAQLPLLRALKQQQKQIEDSRRPSTPPNVGVPPTWFNANPPSWTNSWSAATSQEFVDSDGKKKWRVKINNN